ncbi:BgTH12-04743 [Blumeria graminis f. sp. triticale]|uniref:BgTH12-04743 n=1 Tax=Blumeria graminis f. sp. triticale TaxID=1689686 RepID=A0A9W4DGI6_BLUGR|nr:BgTH12-04743 [Blumeria graminis f. sp. triticale]
MSSPIVKQIYLRT